MHAVIRGDAQAYKALLEAVSGPLRNATRKGFTRFGIEPNDVEDVQETLLAIHLKRHTWKIGAPVAPWIMAIARISSSMFCGGVDAMDPSFLRCCGPIHHGHSNIGEDEVNAMSTGEYLKRLAAIACF